MCIILYFLKTNLKNNFKIEFYTTQETGQTKSKKSKCVTVTPIDTTNMDCGTGLYMQAILNIPGNSTQIKCCRIK